MTKVLSYVLAALVGAAFVVAGFGKLLAPEASLRVLRIVEIPFPIAETLLAVLPGAELALGLALIFAWRSRLLFGLSAILPVVFIIFLLVLARVDYQAKCSCFGPLVANWTGGGPKAGIIRNILFILALTPSALHCFRVHARADSIGT